MSEEAPALLAQGLALEAAGRHDEALARYQRAVARDPRHGPAWRHYGNLLRRAGRLGPASECFERALATGDDPALNTFFLSAIGVGPVVPQAPAPFVRALFDDYAPRFDAHLQGELHYRAPERLAALLARAAAPRYPGVLDLGCGTGLVGRALGPLAGHLTGVDLAPRMLEQAGRSGVYTRLVASDIGAYLHATDERYDLVVACDVLIYLGALDDLFAGVARVLRPRASFGFTIETCDAQAGYDLLPTLRYAHSERYMRELSQRHGFAVRAVEAAALREQQAVPVAGLILHLELA